MYNVNTTLFCNVVGTLHYIVVINFYVVATLLARLFHNVVKSTF